MSEAAVQRVVLVGMMCSGKSAVGAALARRLGWTHLDLDREIEREAGRTVREIFATDGEAAFRRMEAEATARIARRTGVVLSPGGGWVTNPALLDALGPGTLCVWLRVSPEEAVRRSAAAPGERPLLAGTDPLAAIRRLLGERERFYARADVEVLTDGRSVDALADQINDVIRGRA
ncbi:MAG TPA: shikimate kinase [Longimicrobium sp.]|jgi:shikimate kinase|uniref:shikimate kinase n=1 Tax=Longimicrobium sp. TaxID=2029185 RepID=UPI002ED93B3A